MPDTINDPTAAGVETAPTSALIREAPVAVPAWPVAPPPGFQDMPPAQAPDAVVEPPAAPVESQAPPSWIDDVAAPVAPQYNAAPPQYTAPPPRYSPPPQQYSPPPAPGYGPQDMAGMNPNDKALYELVHRPEDWVRGMAATEVQNTVGPIIDQVRTTSAQIGNYINTQANAQERMAKNNVKTLYNEVMNQDEDYNSNPRIKAEVDRTFQSLLGNSIQAARNGNFDDISTMSSLSPLEARATLNAIKTMNGVAGSQTLAPNVGTAVVERPTASTPTPSVEITADEEQAIAWRERVDPTFRARYIDAKKVAIERGDWQF